MLKEGLFMDLLIDLGVIVSDFILGIFSGHEYKKINKWIKK
jgi:hypothetical protein